MKSSTTTTTPLRLTSPRTGRKRNSTRYAEESRPATPKEVRANAPLPVGEHRPVKGAPGWSGIVRVSSATPKGPGEVRVTRLVKLRE